MQNKSFTKERILEIHEYLINRYGGSQGVRDLAGLESAIYTPFQTFAGKLLYPTVEKRAAQAMTFEDIENFIIKHKK